MLAPFSSQSCHNASSLATESAHRLGSSECAPFIYNIYCPSIS